MTSTNPGAAARSRIRNAARWFGRSRLLRLMATFVPLYFALTSIDLGDAIDVARGASPILMLVALALMILQLPVLAARWSLALRDFGHHLGFLFALRSVSAMVLFNQVLPTSLGGDASRLFLLRGRGVPVRRATICVLADRIVALTGLAILMTIWLPNLARLLPGDTLFSNSVLTACASMIVAVAAGYVFLGPFKRIAMYATVSERLAWLPVLANDLHRLMFSPRVLTQTIPLAIVGHMITLSVAFVILRAGDVSISFVTAAALLTPVILLSSLPISIGGWGVRELTAVAIFGAAGLASETGLYVATALGIMQVIQGIFGGVAMFLSGDLVQTLFRRANRGGVK